MKKKLPMNEIDEILKDLKKKLSTNNIDEGIETKPYVTTILSYFRSRLYRLDSTENDILKIKFLLDIIVMWGILPVFIHKFNIYHNNKKGNPQFIMIINSIEKDKVDDNLAIDCLESMFNIYQSTSNFKKLMNEYYLTILILSILYLENEGDKKRDKLLKYRMLFIENVNVYFIFKNLLSVLSVPVFTKGKFDIKKEISILLSKCLIKPNGVFGLVRNITQNQISIEKIYAIVNKVLLRKPSSIKISNKEYYSNIMNQLFTIVKNKYLSSPVKEGHQLKSQTLYEDVVLVTISEMINMGLHDEFKIFFFNKFTFWIRKIVKMRSSQDIFNKFAKFGESQEALVVKQNMIDFTLTFLEKLFCYLNKTMLSHKVKKDVSIWKYFDYGIIKVLMEMYSFVNSNKLVLKNSIEKLCYLIFRNMERSRSEYFFLSLINTNIKKDYVVEGELFFAPSDSGGTCVKASRGKRKSNLENKENEESKKMSAVYINLLKHINSPTLIGKLFTVLLSLLEKMKNKPVKSEHIKLKTLKVDTTLGSVNFFLVINLIEKFVGSFNKLIQSDSYLSLLFSKYQLLFIDFSVINEDAVMIEKTISTFGIIYSVLITFGGNNKKDESENRMMIIVKELETVVKKIQQIGIQNKQINQLISTVLLLFPTLQESKEKGIDKKGLSGKIKFILEDLQNPLVPIQAYALGELRKFILSKDEYVRKELTRVLSLFISQLDNDESYIYLSAIRGLVALADKFGGEIIPTLTKKYRNRKFHYEKRMKIGESLLQIARLYSQLLPVYSKYFVNVFLHCTNENNFLIRMSAMSNIAELAYILKDAISPFLQDIVDCVTNLVERDKNKKVRRASVLVFNKLVSGMDKNIFRLVDDQLKKIFEVLDAVEFYDKDEIVRINSKRTKELIHAVNDSILFPEKFFK